MKNIDLATRVIESLVAAGIEEFCLCAGARNSPLIYLFDENPHLKAYHFFEERSAAFFALGRIAATKKPVAVITTSGTASAELLPAAIEATYSSLPLIMITADRPRRYRKTGAPQAIDQVGLFSYYIEVAYDLDEENSHISLKSLSWKKPIHINICFKEPLMDAPLPKIEIPAKTSRIKFPESIPSNMIDDLENFLQDHQPLVLVSTVPEKHLNIVKNFLIQLQCPIYVEGISNLRGHPELEGMSIYGGEKSLHEILDHKKCDSILRIGGVPTIRLWRDLEDKRMQLPIFSVGYNHFSGLSREIRHFSHLDVLGQVELKEEKVRMNKSVTIEVLRSDRSTFELLQGLFQKYPKSEPGMIHFLGRHLKDKSVYLGNSLPIREWDFASPPEMKPARVAGNRGANGIDGQLSTFLGWCKPDQDNWALVGDLTALYDLASLWIMDQIQAEKIKIVVLNNHGGQIFDRMFQRKIFLNEHQLEFSSWAKMWKMEYTSWSEIPATISELNPRQIIELKPDAQQTALFWDEYSSTL